MRRREARSRWREENRDEYRAMQRDSYKRRKDKLAECRNSPEAKEAKRLYDEGYRDNNGGKIAERKRKYYLEHRDAIIMQVSEYRARRREEIRQGRAHGKIDIRAEEQPAEQHVCGSGAPGISDS